MDFDLVVRGGLVVDGTGAAPFRADVGVIGEAIAAVGQGLGAGREEIDATGRIVTPGFIDIHTHYDGQVTWDQRLKPSSSHGVTTAVIGNCGVGFAPCRPADRDALIRLMEGVEDIPNPVLTEGLSWEWASFPDFLALLASRRYDMDIAALVPHAALRVYVMGERGIRREAATPEDLAEMERLFEQAMDAGAMGVGTSRTIYHKSSDGGSTPTLGAAEAELGVFADVMARRGDGMFQLVTDFNDDENEFEMIRNIARRSGRPVTFAIAEGTADPLWRRTLARIANANAEGLKIRAQALGRAVGVIQGHALSINPFCTAPSYRALADLPFDARIARLREPETRAAILRESGGLDPAVPLTAMISRFELMFPLEEQPDYEPSADRSIAARAAAAGVSPLDYAYDMMLEDGGHRLIYLAVANYVHGNLDSTHEMLSHPDVVFGLGDGGAHCGAICDASYSTFALTHWVRDREHGRFPLEHVVHRLTGGTAEVVGFGDRGRIAPGLRADLNVIDLDALRLYAPTVAFDLPAGGRRLLQEASGYDATIVRGAVVRRNDIATDALPGRLVRSGQPAAATADLAVSVH